MRGKWRKFSEKNSVEIGLISNTSSVLGRPHSRAQNIWIHPRKKGSDDEDVKKREKEKSQHIWYSRKEKKKNRIISKTTHKEILAELIFPILCCFLSTLQVSSEPSAGCRQCTLMWWDESPKEKNSREEKWKKTKFHALAGNKWATDSAWRRSASKLND